MMVLQLNISHCLKFLSEFMLIELIIFPHNEVMKEMNVYRVSQKKVMPFVIQICRELLVVEI